jgi:hypothetical protein
VASVADDAIVADGKPSLPGGGAGCKCRRTPSPPTSARDTSEGSLQWELIDILTPGAILADEEVRGFVARKLSTGAVTYGFRYRNKKTAKQRWIGLDLHGLEQGQRNPTVLTLWHISKALGVGLQGFF